MRRNKKKVKWVTAIDYDLLFIVIITIIFWSTYTLATTQDKWD